MVVYYYCHSHQTPRGGQKHTYRHVDILTSLAAQACIVHAGGAEFHLDWFENSTPTISWEGFLRAYTSEDFLVIPEDWPGDPDTLPCRTIVFNKNVFYGFSNGERAALYNAEKVIGAFVISEHNREHLSFAFPALPVWHIPVEIDDDLYRYLPLANKDPRIVVSSKNPLMVNVFHTILRSRSQANLNHFALFEWILLEGYTQEEAAELLTNSLVAVSFSRYEGQGRFALEAISCGCLLFASFIGPLGFLSDRESDCQENVIAAIKQLEAIMAAWRDKGLEIWQTRVNEMRRRCEGLFGKEEQGRRLQKTWEHIWTVIKENHHLSNAEMRSRLNCSSLNGER